jgi:Zn-dependent metalloprotease
MRLADRDPAPKSGQSPACCFIAPPDLLARIAEEGDPEQQKAAIRTLAASASIRTQRSLVTRLMRQLDVDVRTLALIDAPPGERQTVYDVENQGRFALPGARRRGHGDSPADDPAVNEAFDGTAETYDFYREVYGRDSVDAQGMELISSVHYSVDFDNAFWNGAQMVYGDGSGRLFQKGAFTRALDVIGHELTHGVTNFTAGLVYSSQPGALNESFSDVFGSLVKQRQLGHTADQADWLIGEATLAPQLGRALRSLKEPGTAFSGDRQPGHMRDYVDLPDDADPRNDNGGVHINSGIPNRAFHLAATAIGGNAWEKAGRIWFATLTDRLGPRSDFEEAAELTVGVAGELFGQGGSEQQAAEAAWKEVGVLS